MRFTKNYFNKNEPIPYLLKCKEENSKYIKQVIKNNSYLLKKLGIKHKDQIQQLRERGVRISPAGISRFRNDKYKTCSITYLQIYAEYWSISLPELMRSDFELSDYYSKME